MSHQQIAEKLRAMFEAAFNDAYAEFISESAPAGEAGELPPLPNPGSYRDAKGDSYPCSYSAVDMRAYARLALSSPPQQLAAQSGEQDRRDAERLDFLEESRTAVYRCERQAMELSTDGSGSYRKIYVFDGWATNMHEYSHPTIRLAIDAAIQAKSQGGAA